MNFMLGFMVELWGKCKVTINSSNWVRLCYIEC
jgi:hypothetical protein